MSGTLDGQEDVYGIYLLSEGGGRKQPGTFARITCNMNP